MKFNFSHGLTATALSLLAALSVNSAFADSTGQAVSNQNPLYPSATAKPAAVQYLVRNAKESPATVDPNLLGDSNSINIARSIFDTLIRQAPTGKYVGVAAKSWDVSKDGLTWTFHLRKNATWTDGLPVTARDFVYSWQRLTDPKTGSPYADYLVNAHVVNAKKINDGKMSAIELGVRALDSYTLQVRLEQPVPWFHQLVTLGVLAPVREDIIAKYGDAWTNPKNIVSNGPYKLTENVINGYLRLQKFPQYWDAKHVLITDSKTIFVNDINALFVKYLANEIKTADIPPNIYQQVLAERPDEVKSYLDPITYFIEFNTAQVANPDVRRAIKLLIDSRTLTDRVLKIGKPTSVYVPYFLEDAQDSKEEAYFNQPMSANNAQAVELLKKAGFTKDKPFKLELTTSRDTMVNNMIVAVQSWIQANSQGLVKLTYRTLDSSAYAAAVQGKDFQARYGYRRADYDQASSFYNTLLCNASQNSTNWCNKNYDSLVLTANKTMDAKKRAELYAQANLEIQKDTPLVPLFIKGARLLQSPSLGGLSLKVSRRFLRDYWIIDGKSVKPRGSYIIESSSK